MHTYRRTDAAELKSFVKTDEGYLLVEGYASRPGILEYQNADGSIRRELVPAEELAKTDSLATLARKPVTLDHPDGEFVTPENVDRLQVGDVAETVEVEELNGFVKIRMAVRKADAIAAVEAGVRELSVGYTVELDETPGEHPTFGRYDAIQKNRRYNHVAIVPRGRAGSEVGLRVDANALADLTARVEALEALVKEPEPTPEPAPKEDRLSWFKERSDLLQVARRAGVEVKDDAENFEIKRLVVAKALGAEPREDAAYIDAAYDMARARWDKDPVLKGTLVPVEEPAPRVDAQAEYRRRLFNPTKD